MSEKAPVVLAIPAQFHFLAPVLFEDLIRVGKNHDGGYIVPRRVLMETDHLLSLGINDDWSFEAQFQSINPAIAIDAYDHTVSQTILAANFVRSVARLFILRGGPKTVFRKARASSRYGKFFSGRNRHFQERACGIAKPGTDATAETMFARIVSDKVFVKMDIEGGEYEVIPGLLDNASRIVALAIEFHDIASNRKLFVDAVRKLLANYEIAHIHANNWAPVGPDNIPEVLEITFVRKDFCPRADRRSRLPLAGLDQPNNRRRAEYAITFNSTQPDASPLTT